MQSLDSGKATAEFKSLIAELASLGFEPNSNSEVEYRFSSISNSDFSEVLDLTVSLGFHGDGSIELGYFEHYDPSGRCLLAEFYSGGWNFTLCDC